MQPQDQKISQLTSLTTLNSTDLIPVVDETVSPIATKNITVGNFDNRYILNAKAFGALGNGVNNGGNDDTSAIQAAITAAQAVGGKVYLPQGTYRITSPLSITSSIAFMGDGPEATIISLSPGNYDGLQIAATSSSTLAHGYIGDFSIISYSNQSSGNGLNIGNVDKWLFNNIHMDATRNGFAGKVYNGVHIGRAQHCVFNNLFIELPINNCMDIVNDSGYDIIDMYITNGCQFIDAGNAGILIGSYNSGHYPQGIYMDNMSCYGCTGDGVQLDTGSSGSIFNIFMQDCILDTNNQNLAMTGSGSIGAVFAFNIWCSYSNSFNVYMYNGVSDVTFDGGNIIWGGDTGIRVDGCQRVRLQNLNFYNNGRSSSGNKWGLEIGPGSASNIFVKNNSFINSTRYPGTNQKGITIANGASNVTLEGNDVSQLGAFTTINPGTGSSHIIRNNKGYNPIGASAISVGASPFTYTAGYTPETIYITGGTVSSIAKNSITLFTATEKSVNLEPGESLIVTYSAAPTMNTDKH